MKLTKRQTAVLDFIKAEIARCGFPPTRKEISAHFGFKHPNAAQDFVLRLERAGTIKVWPKTARGIKVLG